MVSLPFHLICDNVPSSSRNQWSRDCKKLQQLLRCPYQLTALLIQSSYRHLKRETLFINKVPLSWDLLLNFFIILCMWDIHGSTKNTLYQTFYDFFPFFYTIFVFTVFFKKKMVQQRHNKRTLKQFLKTPWHFLLFFNTNTTVPSTKWHWH